MLTLSPTLLIVIGILTTAVAQVLLKKAAAFEIRTSSWIVWMGLSALSYAVSFVAYSRILKYFRTQQDLPGHDGCPNRRDYVDWSVARGGASTGGSCSGCYSACWRSTSSLAETTGICPVARQDGL